MVLVFKEKNEIKTDDYGLKDYYDAYGIDYEDDFDDGDVKQVIDLRGFCGYKKVDKETLKLSFNDGDVIDINVAPEKMASVISKIMNKDLRKTKVRVKCY